MEELHREISNVEVDNILHPAKALRAGELHISRAKAMFAKVKAAAIKLKRESNSNNADGIKQISKAIGCAPANPLICVKRDGDTNDGGQKGEIATDPQEVDAIVNRAWEAIYDGMS